MKNFQKTSLLTFAMLLVMSLFIFSCEPSEAIDEEVTPALTEEVLLMSVKEVDSQNRIPDCWCKYRHASRRTSTSSYVYCYGYNGIAKNYILADTQGNVLQTKSTSNYFTYFSGLQSGKTYKYRTYTSCNRPRYSPWTTFTQSY